ncbi:MAG: hypothetical protein HDS30_06955 [Bacteroides sp.]|nr:hypothetical protein [Bacteroides sp.]
MLGFEHIDKSKECLLKSVDSFNLLHKIEESELNTPLETPKVSQKIEGIQKAPEDSVQISEISDCLSGFHELNFENWVNLSPSERMHILQDAENKIAEISHRFPCSIKVSDMPLGEYGNYYSDDKSITLNARYVNATDFNSYKETLDTLVHEGRHAYQDYNINENPVHPRSGEVTNWKWNEFEIGYQNAELSGFEAYAMQPVEADARAFAEDVLCAFLKR